MKNHIRSYVLLVLGLLGVGALNGTDAVHAAGESSGSCAGRVELIDLLSGQLVDVQTRFQSASLVHGAAFWEFDIVQALYVMLVAPTHDARRRLVPSASRYPLGTVLQRLFHMAGGSFLPTSSMYEPITGLTPVGIGRLYSMILAQQEAGKGDAAVYQTFFGPLDEKMNKAIEEHIATDAAVPAKRKNKVITKGKGYIVTNIASLSEALAACAVPTLFNPPHLLPVLVMAYFWARYIIGATNVVQAETDLKAFNKAAGINARYKPGKKIDESLQYLQTMVWNRIQDRYEFSIPYPLSGRGVVVKGSRPFSDCVERLLHQLFSTIFYVAEEQCFKIDHPEDYDAQIVNYFKTYNTAGMQGLPEARNAWATCLAERSDIVYKDSVRRCEVISNPTNVACLIAQLAPTAYTTMEGACAAEGSGCTAPKTEEENRAKAIWDHFAASPACIQRLVRAFVDRNGLSIIKWESDEAGALLWHLQRGDEEAMLECSIKPGHSYSKLITKNTSSSEAINDPLLACLEAIDVLPDNPDDIDPLVYAATSFMNNEFYAGWLALLPLMPCDELHDLKKNWQGWDHTLVNDDLVDFDNPLGTSQGLNDCFIGAAAYGLVRTCSFLKDRGATGNVIDKRRDAEQFPYGNTALLAAVEENSLTGVRYLCEHCDTDVSVIDEAGDISIINAEEHKRRALLTAKEEENEEIATYLQKHLLVAAEAAAAPQVEAVGSEDDTSLASPLVTVEA